MLIQLRFQEPPVFATRAAVAAWQRKYGTIRTLESAGHLELQYGERIREAGLQDASALRDWLAGTVSVRASLRTCQKWISTDWSTSGKLLTPRAVEEAAGGQLRLAEYADRLAADANALAEVLAERQPPILVTGAVLGRWYAQYHPVAGPVRYNSAAELDAAMGGEMRSAYSGMGARPLQHALGARRKLVAAASGLRGGMHGLGGSADEAAAVIAAGRGAGMASIGVGSLSPSHRTLLKQQKRFRDPAAGYVPEHARAMLLAGGQGGAGAQQYCLHR